MSEVTVSALSHEGAVRDHNEDSLVAGAWTVCAAVTRAPQTLVFSTGQRVMVAVADGLGGHPAGELASAVVVQELARTHEPPGDETSVRALVEACNQAVYDAAALDPARTGMGTTVAGVVIDDEAVLAFNVGDSRTYVVDGSDLSLLSLDDNPPLAPGQTHTSVLTQMLGGHTTRQRIDAHVVSRPRDAASRYLVCTDGLTDVVDEDRIASLLAEHHGDRAAYELWRAAVDAGGPDNITLAVIEPAAT